MKNFDGQIVIVTGAAGNLGSAVAKAFAEAGATACCLDHRKGRLATIFPEADEHLRFYEGVDITDREAMIAVGQKIVDELGSVDGLVNTVGGFTMGERVDQISAKTWERMINLNIMSLLNASAAVVPHMIKAESGKIVTIGSGASLKGGAKMGAYSAAKAAVLRLTESLAEELKSSNIQVNCVLPKTIDTPENRKDMPKADFSKWVTPEQIAQVILFLASPAADEITGAALPVFGAS